MNKIIESIQKILTPVGNWMNSNKEVCALRDGMMASIPLTIVGAIFLIVMQFPYLDTFAPSVYTWLMDNCWHIYVCTFSVIALTMLLATAYSYSNQLGIDKLYGVISAVVAFLIVTPIDGSISLENIGPNGMFVALIVSLLAVRIFYFVISKNIVIKLPEQVPENVSQSFISILPIAAVIITFWIVRVIFINTPYMYLHNFINTVLAEPLMKVGTGLGGALVVMMIQQILWWFGIHGSNVVMTVYQPVLLSAAAANIEASLLGQPLPYVISYAWWFTFTTMFNLSLPLALLVGGKSKRCRSVGKMSLVPAIFCIHEPVLFGLPVVLNPLLFIPFTIGQCLQFTFIYLVSAAGICPIPTNAIPWTTPPIIGGLLATNFNILGAVFQVAVLAVGVIILLPFIKVLDKQYLQEEKNQSQEN